MIRSFYSYAAILTGIYVIIEFFQSIIFLRLGAELLELPSFAGWFVFVSLVWLAWSLIMLKYYHYKQYWFTFWAASISVVASLHYTILIPFMIAKREITDYYITATLVVNGTIILYAISLIFSSAGQRPWLRAAGIFLTFLHLVLAFSFIWAVTTISVRLNGTNEKIEQWTSVIAILGNIIFLMNFWGERAAAKKVSTSSSHQESLTSVLAFVVLTVGLATMIFVPKLGFESIRASDNPNQVTEGARLLAEPFEGRTYVNIHNDTLRYRLMLPTNYDSTKKYPLVVCLHGSSGCGLDNVLQVAASPPAQWLSNKENKTKYPAFLFVPQCPPKNAWGGIRDVPAVDSLVFETILALEEEFAIDVNRCYVLGNSLGGYGAWHFICTRPEMFTAAIPISGGGNAERAQNIIGKPVWAFHGQKDRVVPVSGSRDIIEAITNAGGNPRYTEYPEDGHHILEKVTSTPGLLDWLFAQERN